ncbi:endolytic transglycosylase MltG [bacterium]|nr:endolytic transglycosylase MltG [bacterium]
MKKIIRIGLVLFLIIGTMTVYWLNEQYTRLFQPVESATIKTVVNVNPGMSAQSIVAMLEAKGLVESPFFFLLYWRLKYAQKPFKAGEYTFSAYPRPIDLLESLVNGSITLHPITIPEGWNLAQIQQRIVQTFSIEPEILNQLCQNGEPLLEMNIHAPNLEGFLFPDTYHFAQSVSADTIVTNMLKRFSFNLTEDFLNRAEEIGLTVFEVVTLASLIEKETALDSERSLVSAVYHNRLKKGMRLQCDPTVIYALPHFKGNLTRADLDYDSPYNTYRYAGLPPGPICSPGRGALEAALYPADVPYLFFVAKGDRSGQHVFSKTLAEHNRAVYNEQILARRKHKQRGK